MTLYTTLAIIIVLIITLIIAPCMTIAFIFYMAGWKVPSIIFLVLGIFNMLRRINNL